MILPLLDVGDVFYHSVGMKYKGRLQALQNRALRVIYRMEHRTNTDQAQKEMGLLALQDRRCLHLIQLACWMEEIPENKDTRKLSTRAHALGRKNIRITKPNNQRYAQSFLYKASSLWNKLPTSAHALKESDKFKNLITEWIGAGTINMP